MELQLRVDGNPLSTHDSVYFFAPRIDEINGLEPTISELTSGKAVYKTKTTDLDRKIQIVNWQTPINDAYDVIQDYSHVIDGDDFRVSIDETKNNIEYTDTIDSVLNVKGATTDTIIEIEVPGHASSTSYNFILPFQNKTSSTPFAADVDWGDGKSDFIRYGNDKDLHHVYPQTTTAKRFQIRISGQFDRINVTQANPAAKSQSSQGGPLSSSDYTTAKTSFKTAVRKIYLGGNEFKQQGTNATINFKGSTGLTTFTSIEGIPNTSAVTTFKEMFSGCTSLTYADIRGLDTSAATNMNGMFQNIGTGLTVVGLHSRNIKSLERHSNKSMFNMFNGTTFNSDELNRCYVAWANNIFTTVPTGTGTASTDIHFHAGSTKYNATPSFDSPNDSSATNIVTAARTIVDVTKKWRVTDGGAA
jgi:surface protein